MQVDVVMRDRDGKFVADFDTVLKDAGAKVVRTAVRAPNQNAFVERWVQSIKHESLNHFIVFGADHFNFLDLRIRRALSDRKAASGARQRDANQRINALQR